MFAIYGGKAEFNQWDLNQFVTNPCMQEGDEVVFYNSHGATYVVNAFEQNGEVLADVPNYLLQMEGNILVDLGQGLERHTECRTTFTVVAQPKPEGYDCQYNVPDRPVKNGGVSSWNDLTDKPFGETKYVGELPVSAYWADDENAAIVSAPIGLEVGKTYVVKWHDVEYEVTGLDVNAMTGGQTPGVGLGNHAALGGPDNGMPFGIVDFGRDLANGMNLFGMIAPANSTYDENFSIKGEQTVIVPLPAKYLPFSIYTVVVDADAGTNITVADKTYAEVAAKVKDPTVQVRAFVNLAYEGMMVQYLNLNFTEYDIPDGEIVFTAPSNEFCFWSMAMKSDGSIDFGTISYKGLDS